MSATAFYLVMQINQILTRVRLTKLREIPVHEDRLMKQPLGQYVLMRKLDKRFAA